MIFLLLFFVNIFLWQPLQRENYYFEGRKTDGYTQKWFFSKSTVNKFDSLLSLRLAIVL